MTTPIYELGDLVTIRKGKKAVEVSEGPSEGFLRYIQIEDLRNNDSIKYARNPKGPNCDENDVLIAWDGAKAGTVGFGLSGLVGSTIAILRPNESVYAPYLGMLLQSKYQLIRDACTGATIPHVSKPFLLRMKIPLPSISQQKRIATILQKADEIEQVVENINFKRQVCILSIFNEIFHLDMTSNPDWPVVELNDVATKINDGEHGTVKRADSGRLYLMARNITKDHSISLKKVSFIPQSEHERIYKRCNPEPGDLMLVCVGATIGKVALVPEMEEFSLARSVALIKPIPALVNSNYLLYLFSSDYVKNQIESLSRTAAQAGLYISKIKSINIPLPPLALQERFAKIANLVENMDNSISLAQNCISSLSQEIFA